ncbi:hypothetical protein AGMMS49938_04940 [Fibrobacterales bacterium]|nr:hypothetical protein AGMMS49938_04940 [Fibrobacterales bacterium]
MNRKIFAGVAAVGILAGGAWADFVIEDFSGETSAFGDYSGAFTWGDAVLGNPENPYSEGDPWLTPNGEYGELINVELGTSGAGAVFVKAAPGTPHAITECTGISFKLKNSAIVQFAVEMDSKPKDSGQHVKNIPVSTNAKVVSVPFSDLSAEYGTAYDLDLSDVSQLSWSFKAGVSGSDVTGLSLEIDDITCLTSGGTTPSSSSAGGGSSSSAGGSGEVGNYLIAGVEDADGYNTVTAYGDYVWGEVHNTATVANKKNTDGLIINDEGVAKLKQLAIKDADASPYSGGSLGLTVETTDTHSPADCVSGFSYYYRGAKHDFVLEFDARDVCGADSANGGGSNKWGKKITTVAANWTKVTVPFGDIGLKNFTWNGADCTEATGTAGTVALEKVTKIAWAMDGKNNPNGTVDLMIDNLVCLTAAGGTVEGDVAPSNNITINSGKLTPIAHNPIVVSGLNVFAVANGLSISSDRSAAVSVYGLNGERVLSKRVSAGSSVVSFNNLQAGIYYVSVKAGSSSKIVKVSVK